MATIKCADLVGKTVTIKFNDGDRVLSVESMTDNYLQCRDLRKRTTERVFCGHLQVMLDAGRFIINK